MRLFWRRDPAIEEAIAERVARIDEVCWVRNPTVRRCGRRVELWVGHHSTWDSSSVHALVTRAIRSVVGEEAAICVHIHPEDDELSVLRSLL